MKKYQAFLVSIFLLVALLVPAQAFAAQGDIRTGGEASYWSSSWSLYPATDAWPETPYRYRWQWTASGTNDNASGHLTMTVTDVRHDGPETERVLDRVRFPVTEVRRVSDGVVEFQVSGHPYTPGDPSWGTGLYRVVDNGKSDDELLEYCFIHEDFHLLATGRAVAR